MSGLSCRVVFGARVPSTGSRISHAVAANVLAFVLVGAAHGASPVFPPVSTFPSGGIAQYTATADVNRDGKQDVFASNLNGVISVLLGNGNGSFKPPKTIASCRCAAGSQPEMPSITRDCVQIYVGKVSAGADLMR